MIITAASWSRKNDSEQSVQRDDNLIEVSVGSREVADATNPKSPFDKLRVDDDGKKALFLTEHLYLSYSEKLQTIYPDFDRILFGHSFKSK